MTLSRHTQVENIAGLLGFRRTELRRQAAYLHLVSAILERPAAEIEVRLPIAGLVQPLVSVGGPDSAQAA